MYISMHNYVMRHETGALATLDVLNIDFLISIVLSKMELCGLQIMVNQVLLPVRLTSYFSGAIDRTALARRGKRVAENGLPSYKNRKTKNHIIRASLCRLLKILHDIVDKRSRAARNVVKLMALRCAVKAAV